MKKKSPKLFNSVPEVISFFTAIFITGLLISEKFTSDMYIAWLCLALGIIALSFYTKSPESKTISLLVATLFVSMFYGAVRYIPKTDFSDLMLLDNSSGILMGRYTGVAKLNRNKTTYTFDQLTYKTNDQNIEIPLAINCRYTTNREKLYPYQYYTMTGKLKIIEFDKKPVFEVASFTNIEPRFTSFISISKLIQEKIIHGLTSVLKKEHAAIAIGFILGDTSQIANKKIFVETGLSHLLAISGQHIMILILLLASILHWFKIPPISRTLLVSIFLTLYATITVGSPSVWRALIMYVSLATAMHLESFSSPIRPISISAFLMLLYDPSLIRNSAFILSFTAVISIIFFRKPLEFIISKLRFPSVLTRYFAVTFSANLGIMPMVAYLFGTVSLSALIVNPLILWSFTFILPISFFISFLSLISIPLGILLSPGLAILLDLLTACLEYFQSMPGLYFYVGNINPIMVTAIYALFFMGVHLFNKWQIIKFKANNEKKAELADIPIRKLPQNEEIKIHIDNKSKAMPRFLEKDYKPGKLQDKPEIQSPFRNQDIVGAINEILNKLKKIPIDDSYKTNDIIPANSLTIEARRLYQRLFSLNSHTIKKEPKRLLQAHIYMLAIVGYELLQRVSTIMNPPLSPNELSIDVRVDNRHLTVAILADSIMNSYLSERVSDKAMKEILKEGRLLFLRALEQLNRILSDESFNQCVSEHIILREKMIKWCYKFICRDSMIKIRK